MSHRNNQIRTLYTGRSDRVIRFSHAGVQPVPLQNITNENPAGPSLGTIPQARFLLAMLHMVTLKHGANSLSLLLNSGTLALTQSVLRLIGQFNVSAFTTLLCPVCRVVLQVSSVELVIVLCRTGSWFWIILLNSL